jgi:hypothetical protein
MCNTDSLEYYSVNKELFAEIQEKGENRRKENRKQKQEQQRRYCLRPYCKEKCCQFLVKGYRHFSTEMISDIWSLLMNKPLKENHYEVNAAVAVIKLQR